METFPQMGYTFGVEFETDFALRLNYPSPFHTTHDASIETDAYHSALNRYPFIFNKKSKLIPTNNIVVGTEFLTPILDLSFSSLVDFFGRFTASMMEYGEPEISDRASIHVHISLPYPTLEILKNILILASHYETMFFYIGGMGYKFRGEKNDAIYCRPILKYGPPCVRGMEGYNQILNVNDLLKSDTILEFWYKYGDIASRDRRYHPVRYHWINLLPMYPNASSYKGTLEFRVFNKTLNPIYISAIIQLCRYFTQLCLKSNLIQLDFNPIIDENQSPELAIRLFDEFSSTVNIDEKVYKIIHKLLTSVTHRINLKEGYVFSHKRDDNPFFQSRYQPEIISKDIIRYPKYVDIHTLRGEV